VRLPQIALVVLGALLCGVPSLGCGSTSGGGGSASQTSVKLVDFAFAPKEVQVKKGETVTWTNTGQTLHNVTGPGFTSKALNPGETFRHRFASAGRFPYVCTLHPQLMRAVVIVQ
jgi:plastocyanin